MKWLKENIKSKIDFILLFSGVGPFVLLPIFVLCELYFADEKERIKSDQIKKYNNLVPVKVQSCCKYLYLLELQDVNSNNLYLLDKDRHEFKNICRKDRVYSIEMHVIDTVLLNTSSRLLGGYNDRFAKILLMRNVNDSDTIITEYIIDRKYLIYSVK